MYVWEKNLSFWESNKYPPLANVLVMDHREKLLDLSVCNKIFEGISIFRFLISSSVERQRPIEERLWGRIWVSWSGGWAHYFPPCFHLAVITNVSASMAKNGSLSNPSEIFPRTSSGRKLVLQDQVDRLPGKPLGWGISQSPSTHSTNKQLELK